MVLMILFLVLTLVFIIGTAIYLNYKKKNINSKIKQSSPIEDQPKGKKKTKKQLEDFSRYVFDVPYTVIQEALQRKDIMNHKRKVCAD